MAHIAVLSQNLPGGTEETHETLSCGLWADIWTWDPQIQSRRANLYTVTFDMIFLIV